MQWGVAFEAVDGVDFEAFLVEELVEDFIYMAFGWSASETLFSRGRRAVCLRGEGGWGRTAAVACGDVETVVSYAVGGFVEEFRYLGRGLRVEDFGEEGGVVAAGGFEEEFARRGTLLSL